MTGWTFTGSMLWSSISRTLNGEPVLNAVLATLKSLEGKVAAAPATIPPMIRMCRIRLPRFL